MSKEQVDLLPDLSQELASMGRGSMQRRIEQLTAALEVAKQELGRIASGCDSKCLVADRALERIERLERS